MLGIMFDAFGYLVILVYVIVRVAVVLGINCTSNAGRKLAIVRGAAEHYYITVPACITTAINSKYYTATCTVTN